MLVFHYAIVTFVCSFANVFLSNFDNLEKEKFIIIDYNNNGDTNHSPR